jgi:DNA-binding CsgD family transcriptional regulator
MSLSPREKEVLSLIASGLTLEQAARRLSISVRSADQYKSRAFEKLGAVSSPHAVALAMRTGVDLEILSFFDV